MAQEGVADQALVLTAGQCAAPRLREHGDRSCEFLYLQLVRATRAICYQVADAYVAVADTYGAKESFIGQFTRSARV